MLASDKLKRGVVLVVDDSPETLGILNELLDREGYTVLIALEGSQALAIAASVKPELILMDAIMPSMDGFETCRTLKQTPELAPIPVIFMTGLSDTESVVRGFNAGGVDYVTKPINHDELLVRLHTHLLIARQTMTTHQALDTAGQYLLTTDGRGQLIWMTPQAGRLLENAKPQALSIETALGNELKTFFNPRYNRQRPIQLASMTQSLQLNFVDQSGPDEYLFSLENPDKPSETEILRRNFPLTEREAEVLLWLGNGKTNQEIALGLSVSPRTVDKHMEQIFRKLDVQNRTTAAGICIRCLSDRNHS